MTPKELLGLWPKPSLETLAGDIGVSLAAVRKWPQRDRIPSEYWLALVRAAHDRGIRDVTFERLAAMHARPVKPCESAEISA